MIDNPNYTRFVNQTYSKPFSPKQKLPHIVLKYAKSGDKILDFGAGKDIYGTKILRENGFDCTAWEIGENFVPNRHDYHAMMREYDIVFASNVFNVQPDGESIAEILMDVQCVLKNEGLFFCNLPKKPRHNVIDDGGMDSMLRVFAHTHSGHGGEVTKIEPHIWMCKYKR
jgi:hypothetical protein